MVDTTQHALDAQLSADIVRRIGEGDGGAEAELVRRYERGLLYLVKRRTSDVELARDICQETFRITIEKLRTSTLDQPERLAGFLRGTALNLLSSDRRKLARHATTADTEAIESIAADDGGPFERLSSEQVTKAVRRLLADLPVSRDREILMRTYLQEEDKESICASLGVDSAHFNRVLFRARERFRALLTQAAQRDRLRVID